MRNLAILTPQQFMTQKPGVTAALPLGDDRKKGSPVMILLRLNDKTLREEILRIQRRYICQHNDIFCGCCHDAKTLKVVCTPTPRGWGEFVQ